MSISRTDVVAEYLREIELRLSGLPLLQRRELLADLEAHIETAREHGAYTESELIEVLQRLGSPEAIAAAAYWEAGPQPPRREFTPAPESNAGVPGWVIAAIVGFVFLFLVGVAGLFVFGRVDGNSAPEMVRAPAPAVQPDLPDRPVPAPAITQ
jgi:uncharacterized membrane protein